MIKTNKLIYNVVFFVIAGLYFPSVYGQHNTTLKSLVPSSGTSSSTSISSQVDDTLGEENSNNDISLKAKADYYKKTNSVLKQNNYVVSNSRLDIANPLSKRVISFNKSSKLSKNGVKLSGENIFKKEKALFYLKKDDDMRLVGETSSISTIKNFTYQQFYKEVKVEGAIYKVREKKETIDAFGFIAEDLKLNTKPLYSESASLEKALKDIDAKEYIWESNKLTSLLKGANSNLNSKPKGELVIVGPNLSARIDKHVLAWKFDIFALNPQSNNTIYVDANTGKVLFKLNNICEVNHSDKTNAKSRYAGDVKISTEHFEKGFRLREARGTNKVIIHTLNLNHNNTMYSDSILTEFIDEDNKNWDLRNENGDDIAIDIHWGAERTVDYFQEVFDRNSLDGNGMEIFTLAHWGEQMTNAQWTGYWAQFGDGNNNRPLTSLGIVSHELVHGITQRTSGLIYEGESGALNESFSDMFAAAIEFYIGKETGKSIWQFGDELYKYGAMRSFVEPKKGDMPQPDTYRGDNWANPKLIFVDNGGVHINSGVSNHWFYLLVEGGEGTNDNEDDYNITGIGIKKAEQIIYRALTEYLTPSSNFADARQASIMATEDLYGLGEEYKQVTNAWYAVGVGRKYYEESLMITDIRLPFVECGSLTGKELVSVVLKNIGTKNIEKGVKLYYKFNLQAPASFGRYGVIQELDGEITLNKTLSPGDVTLIEIKDELDYSEKTDVMLYYGISIDFKAIEDSPGLSQMSYIFAPFFNYGEKTRPRYEMNVSSLDMPKEVDSSSKNIRLKLGLINKGCKIESGDKVSIGYIYNEDNAIIKETIIGEDWKTGVEKLIELDKTFDFSTKGIHSIRAFVAKGENDIGKMSDTISISVYNGAISSFPYVENFNKTSGGWVSKHISGNYMVWNHVYNPYYYRFEEKGSHIWATANDVGLIGSKGSEGYRMDSEVVLESPLLDFTNIKTPHMTFDPWINFWPGDGMILEYTIDNGKTWHKIDLVNYNVETNPSGLLSAPWFSSDLTLKNTIPPHEAFIPELAGKKGKIRFHMASEPIYSNNNKFGASIDNIIIREANDYGIEISDVNIDVLCGSNKDSDKVEVVFINKGKETNLNISMSYSILDKDGEIIKEVAETYTKSNAIPFEHLKYTFKSPIGSQSNGVYDIKVTVGEVDFTKNLEIWDEGIGVVSQLPYMMDFEDDDTSGDGWRQQYNKGSTGWRRMSEDDLPKYTTWNVSVGDHGMFMASDDNECSNCDKENDMLIMPTLDLSNYSNVNLRFDAYGDGQRHSDGFVKVSTDNGKTWEVIHTIYNWSGWQEESIDISNYAGNKCVKIAFVHTDNKRFANGFAIDNIKVLDFDTDIKLTKIGISDKVFKNANLTEFYIYLKNLGIKDVNSFNLKYQVFKGGNAIGDVYTKDITGVSIPYKYPLNTYDVVLDELPELEAGDGYTIKAEVVITNDGDSTNNELESIPFTVLGSYSSKSYNFSDIQVTEGEELPLLGDGSNGWLTSEESYLVAPWKVALENENRYLDIPEKDHTTGDGNFIYVNLNGTYKYGVLNSPLIELEENSLMSLFYAIQANTDSYLSVEIKSAGKGWKEVGRVKSERNTGGRIDNNWKKMIIDLSQYNTEEVIFRFKCEKDGGYMYVQIDDVKISNTGIKGMKSSIEGPYSACGDDVIKVRIDNLGIEDISANDLKASYTYYNKGEEVEETISTPIPAGESILFQFEKQPDFDNVPEHLFIVSVENVSNQEYNEGENEMKFVYQKVEELTEVFDNDTKYAYEGEETYLDAGYRIFLSKIDGVEYKWSNGETTRAITVDKPGKYSVEVTLPGGCTITDDVTVKYLNFENKLKEGAFCETQLELNPGDYKSYLWMDGSKSPNFIADKSGTYYVTVFNENEIGKTLSTSLELKDIPTITQKEGDILVSSEAKEYQWYLNFNKIEGATSREYAVKKIGVYSVEVSNMKNCYSTSEYVSMFSLSNEEYLKGDKFSVYPVPSVDKLNFKFKQILKGETKVEVIDLSGAVVKSLYFDGMPNQIDIEKLTPGAYFIKVSNKNKEFVHKILKK